MSAAGKIAKVGTPDETELSVAQALYDLETSVPDLRKELRPLQFNSAREVYIPLLCILIVQLEVASGKKAIVIFVPIPLLTSFNKIQQR